MTTPADLVALLVRVKQAQAPDRALDAAIHVALFQPEQAPDDLRRFRLPLDHMEMCAPGTYWLCERSGRSLHTAPTYTTDIQAAIALCDLALCRDPKEGDSK